MNKALYDVKWIKNKRRRINMAVISNREAYLASEPEMDITQFHKTALDLKYADESENQILDIFYPEEVDRESLFDSLVCLTAGNTLYCLPENWRNSKVWIRCCGWHTVMSD